MTAIIITMFLHGLDLPRLLLLLVSVSQNGAICYMLTPQVWANPDHSQATEGLV